MTRLPVLTPATREPKKVRLPLAHHVRPSDEVRPEYAVWEITLRCDLACRHCGSRAGRARPDELDTDEALALVAQMAELGIRDATIIGGEAYLRSDWHVIAQAMTDAGINCSMTTGGRNLTRERVEQAKRAGISTVSVSIDGLETTHDHLRAVAGSYAAALRALDELEAAGIPRSVNTQLCAINLREIEPLLDEIAKRKIHSWQVQITVAMGRAADHPELLLQPWQMLELMPLVARLARETKRRRIVLWPGSNIGYFGPYEALIRGDHPDCHQTGCDAGLRSMGIEANGDIKGCPSLPTSEYVGGNIREHSLRDIWQRSAALQLQPRARRRRALGSLRRLLLRRRLQGRVHLDRARVVWQARQQPLLSPPRARAPARGSTRAHRAGQARPGRALRSRRVPADRGGLAGRAARPRARSRGQR